MMMLSPMDALNRLRLLKDLIFPSVRKKHSDSFRCEKISNVVSCMLYQINGELF